LHFERVQQPAQPKPPTMRRDDHRHVRRAHVASVPERLDCAIMPTLDQAARVREMLARSPRRRYLERLWGIRD
jgi:hypothetical protein